MFDVVKIVFDFYLGLFGVGGVALGNLCPAGDAGFDDVAVVVEGDFLNKLVDKDFLFGAGADKAHVAFEDIPELGQFVDAGFADDVADAGDAGVAQLRHLGAVFFGVAAHAAEFVDAEFAAAAADAVLAEQDVTGAFEFDGDGGNEHYRQGKGGRQQDKQDVGKAFDEDVGRRWQEGAEVVFVQVMDFYAAG
ncbi:hypothetical protein BGI32_02540 [Snodgrassella alvi]|uniref:Uncharacterized protein n=1 Tax=Snodgrassella alvi TaxID=1196083 RepID=A0A2N9WVS0_9NEIS|nr:hypothetical protein BGI32_02540 [Snodgrassella alvi]